MCFLAKSQYLALSVHSVDPAQVSFEAVKVLLEKLPLAGVSRTQVPPVRHHGNDETGGGVGVGKECGRGSSYFFRNTSR
jgi:hypothetical protein